MKAIVTGGAGFIGSHVTDALIDRGIEVVVIDDLSSGRTELLNPRARFYELDIRSPEVEKIFHDNRFDAVFHLAAQLDVRKSVDDPIFDADINVLGSINLLKLSAESGVRKFIFSSTGGAIYGEQDYFPADEKHALRPISPYGIAKLSVERYMYFYRVEYGLDTVALRYSNVYGPRQNSHGEAGVVAIFCQRLFEGKPLIIFGDGGQTRDYLFVSDVVSANMKALDGDFTGEVNIGTGRENDLNKMVALLERASGKKVETVYEAPKPGEQYRSCLDNGLANEVLSWRPEVALEKGVALTVEFFRKSPDCAQTNRY